jgi:glucose/arabinose dehydrogenase/PKD repeat protein
LNTTSIRGQSAMALPPDFQDSLLANVGSPTGLAFTPDGRLLVTTQTGKLRVIQNGALLANAALDLTARICANSERGVLSVAVDPNFSVNRFIYLFYTLNKSGGCPTSSVTNPINRVSRFVLSDANTVDTSQEVVLVDNIPSPGGNHNAGDVHFGKDGFLYISTGDGGWDPDSGSAGNNDAARDQHVLMGKILRVTSTGAIPPGNPYLGADSARCNVTGRTDPGKKCQETFAWGLRNPFRIAFDPNASTTRFFINDVGQNVWEEINVGQAGADYGWNVREGKCANGSTTNCGSPPSGMTNPIFAYSHSDGCGAITGGAFVPAGDWPPEYDGAYLFGDYVCGKIFQLVDNGGGNFSRRDLVTGLGVDSAVVMMFGPYESTQALYYTTYSNGGQVRILSYSGPANRAPDAVAEAIPTFGDVPLDVVLDGTASSDADGDDLDFEWDFGDGQPHDTAPTVSHRYSSAGTYTAVLTVRDSHGAVDTDTVRIDVGNFAPVPAINAPSTSTRFRVGQTITLQGSATDSEDGTIPDANLRWAVTLHHNTHTHPFVAPTAGNDITFTTPAPEDLLAAGNSYLEITLTATDSRGATATVSQDLRPRLVDVTFGTSPTGLRVVVNGTTITAPQTVVSWEAYRLDVNAPAQTGGSGQSFAFASWSDGGAAQHSIVTPASPGTYTAAFTPVSPPSGLAAAYGFNEGSGTAIADASGNANGGSVTGAAWVDGRYGKALSFDGVNDLVTVSDAQSLDLTGGVTLEAWVFPRTTSGWRTVLLKERSGQLAYGIYANTGTNRASVEVATGANLDVRSATPLAVNTWTHLAGTYDGATLRLYVNGTQVSSRSATGAITASGSPLRIGGNTIWGEYFDGLIDEVRIYTRALSQSEIQADMNAPVGVPSPSGDFSIAGTPSTQTVARGGSASYTASITALDGFTGTVSFSVTGLPAGATPTFTPATVSGAGSSTLTIATSAATATGSYPLTIRGTSGSLVHDASVTMTVTAPPPPGAGLVAALGFNETTGTTASDASGMGNHGTILNATRTTGKYGSALVFNGTNAWVTVADAASLDLTTGMTLEAWVFPRTLSGWRSVLLKERPPGELAYALYGNTSTNRASVEIVGSSGLDVRATAPLTLNAWTHLAATYDGATLRLFVNGTQVGSRAASGAMAGSGSALRIGGNSVWGEYFDGYIDEVRIYNRALSASEVANDMNTPIAP